MVAAHTGRVSVASCTDRWTGEAFPTICVIEDGEAGEPFLIPIAALLTAKELEDIRVPPLYVGEDEDDE